MRANRNALTELADRHGSDKGSRKHRYTELYHLLFAPLREREIVLLELGLMIGGPEHGAPAGRAVGPPPSVAMWLDWFPKGRAIGLDVSDFSAFAGPRFDFVRCDLDRPEEIAAAAAEAARLGPPDIVIDDASHASRHQQAAFLALFPVLKPGGLYLIEDLRWQPPAYEAKPPAAPKTAALWRGFLATGAFAHPDPAAAEAMNALRPEIAFAHIFPAKFEPGRRDQLLLVHKA